VCSRRGQWRAHYPPQLKKCTALLWKLKGDIPALSIPACGPGTPVDSPDPARLGDLLCHRCRESLLRLRAGLGGKEGAAPPDACTEPSGLRLEEVE
jgi:hypothetical protein